MKERRLTRYPFEGYYTNSPSFHSGIHRYQLFLYPVDEKSGLENTSITYSRYLYCTHNKIKLADDIHVDHIDGDRTNDKLENLQLLTRAENFEKRKIQTHLSPNRVSLKCPVCETLFIREQRQTFLSKGGVFTACSRICAGKFRRKLQLANKTGIGIDELQEAISNNIVSRELGNIYGSQIIPEKHQLEDWTLFTDDYPESVKPSKEIKYCAICKKSLVEKQQKTCSLVCDAEYRKLNKAYIIPLQSELNEMLLTMSPETIGKKYGISGNAVRKWIKKYKNKIDNNKE